MKLKEENVGRQTFIMSVDFLDHLTENEAYGSECKIGRETQYTVKPTQREISKLTLYYIYRTVYIECRIVELVVLLLFSSFYKRIRLRPHFSLAFFFPIQKDQSTNISSKCTRSSHLIEFSTSSGSWPGPLNRKQMGSDHEITNLRLSLLPPFRIYYITYRQSQ